MQNRPKPACVQGRSKRLQPFWVQQSNLSPGELYDAVALEIAEHTGDHLPMGTEMVGDDLMGDLQLVGIFDGGFLQKKGGQAFIQAFPEDLLDEPHDVGKTRGHQLVGVVRERSGLCQEIFIELRRDQPELRILFRCDRNLKLYGI